MTNINSQNKMIKIQNSHNNLNKFFNQDLQALVNKNKDNQANKNKNNKNNRNN